MEVTTAINLLIKYYLFLGGGGDTEVISIFKFDFEI